MFHLVVTAPFRDYRRGDQITDPAEVARVLGCHEAAFVVRIAAPAASPAAKE